MAIIIMTILTILMNTLAHLFEPPHSMFIKKTTSMEDSLNRLQESTQSINNVLITLQQSNEEIMNLLKNSL